MKLAPERQCELNLAAVFDLYCLTPPPLIEARQDRCFYENDGCFVQKLRITGGFEKWDLIEAGAHKDPFGSPILGGLREARASCSCQIVEHEKSIEVDIDEWNPNHGAAPALLHGIEVLYHAALKRKTQPERIAELIKKRQAKEAAQQV